MRVHTTVAVGRDLEADAVSVRLHRGGPQGTKPMIEVAADILAAITARRAQFIRFIPCADLLL